MARVVWISDSSGCHFEAIAPVDPFDVGFEKINIKVPSTQRSYHQSESDRAVRQESLDQRGFVKDQTN